MPPPKTTIRATVSADRQKAWNFYTLPEHITQWNFASGDWQFPTASNDLRVGGTYRARMEAKDGIFGFDFEVLYDEIVPGERLVYIMTDGRQVAVNLADRGISRTLSTF